MTNALTVLRVAAGIVVGAVQRQAGRGAGTARVTFVGHVAESCIREGAVTGVSVQVRACTFLGRTMVYAQYDAR